MQLLRSHIIRGPFRRARRNCLCNYGRCNRDNYQRYITKDGTVDYCRGCHRPGEPFRHVMTGRPQYTNVRPCYPNEEMNCFLNIEAQVHRGQPERALNVAATTEQKTVSWCAQELENMQIKEEGNQPKSNLTISFNEPKVSTSPSTLEIDNAGYLTQ